MEPTIDSATESPEPELTPPIAYTKERFTDIWTAWRDYAEQLATKYGDLVPERLKKVVAKSPEGETTAEPA